jgi:hypothetical protein
MHMNFMLNYVYQQIHIQHVKYYKLFVKRQLSYILANVCHFQSEFLATDTEVPGSIPGATRFSE